MSVTVVERLPELPGVGRLGRHREHDERSRAFAVEQLHTLQSVSWARRSPIFDQGDIGSCTGNAMAGAIGTDSVGREGMSRLTEADALTLYERATHLDRIPGSYPPDDTGSSGLAVAKAAKKSNLISSYRHAFSVRAALAALQTGPAIVGMEWLTGCDEPDASGLISYTGQVRGGHEIELLACDIDAHTVTFANSWGEGWGASGYFSMTWDDFGAALRRGGDVTVPVWT